MTSLSDLPNEVLLMIWHTLDVEDVYNFSTILRRFYLLFKPLLPEHLDLQRRLSTISNNGKHGPNYFAHILKEILTNPRAARYPSVLEFLDFEVEWNDWRVDKTPSNPKLPETDLISFENIVKTCGFVDDDRMDDWLYQIYQGHEEPLIALLMLLLPNLTFIQHRAWSGYIWYIRDVLNNISLTKPCNSLKRLRTVNLGSVAESGSYHNVHLEAVRVYSDIPSVRTIVGRHISCDEDDLLMSQQPFPCSSNITNLHLIDCWIDTKPLSDFLLTITSLENFTYIPNRTDTPLEPYWIRTALLAHQRFTLNFVKLLAHNQPKSYMGSMKLFPCLEELETDLVLLLGDLSETTHELEMMLPESIKVIKLHVKNPEDGLSDWKLLQDFISGLKNFPNLTKIHMVGDFNMKEEVQSTQISLASKFEALEVQLTFDKQPDTG